ncbi:GSCOCG00010354001-RA-CDS [Cotesia congregata]|uniref:Uncharacterized protein n=1 Tax=Cotesia congregata TaxID=51543 RepID=A0A8J2MJR1_COTCN|nr:GSCOCG00010354001-RA-CDS [Cotesia congregata]CAG5078990.1 Protein of unknown function [Cotesia congregata]
MWVIRATLCCYLLSICNVSCNRIKIIKQTGISSDLHRDAKELAETCFKSNSNPIIISADLLSNDWDPGGNSWVVIDHKFQKQATGFNSAYPTYVLSFESIGYLKTTINHFRKSTAWSIKSPFLIVERKSLCLNAVEVLQFMWKQDLLTVYYLCSHRDATIVFTLNSYANYAPAPWLFFHDFSDNGKISTLYGMEYTKDRNICRPFTFDKTKKLNGHKVKLGSFMNIENIPRENLASGTTKYLQKMKQKGSMTIYHILSLIKAKDKTWFFSSSTKMTSFFNGYVSELAVKSIDVMDKMFQLADTNYTFMDILTRYDIATYSILTKKSSYLTTISQVACNYQFLFLTIIMLMLIGMIIIVNNKFDISSGMLDVMSLTAGMGVITPLDRLSMRIIYISGFLFVFTVMPEFQGQVSAILSEPLRRNVESLKDLYDNNYHVYFDGMLTRDLLNEKLWVTDKDIHYLHPSNHSELRRCAVQALFNSTVACISLRNLQLSYASKTTNLHVSRDVIFEKYFIYWVRKDWSLKDKLDRVSSWTVESGFNTGQKFKSIKYFSKKLRETKRIEERASFEFIDLDTLILSYMIVLGLSLWGLVAFGLELLFHKYEKRCRQTLIRRRYRMELRSQLRNISSIEQVIPSNPGTSFGV